MMHRVVVLAYYFGLCLTIFTQYGGLNYRTITLYEGYITQVFETINQYGGALYATIS